MIFVWIQHFIELNLTRSFLKQHTPFTVNNLSTWPITYVLVACPLTITLYQKFYIHADVDHLCSQLVKSISSIVSHTPTYNRDQSLLYLLMSPVVRQITYTELRQSQVHTYVWKCGPIRFSLENRAAMGRCNISIEQILPVRDTTYG